MARNAPDLLMVTQYYWPEPIGSAPYCTDLAEWLAGAGWGVKVLTNRPHYPEGVVSAAYSDGSRDREAHNGVDIVRLPPWRPDRRGALGRMLRELLFLARGLGALAMGQSRRSDLVVSLCPSILTVLLGRIACRRRGRHFTLVHDIQSGLAAGLGMVGGRWMPRLIQAVERWALNRVDGIFVLSEQMRERLHEQGVTVPVHVLPIWVDSARIQPAANVAAELVTALYSGNLGRKQALDQVISLAEVLQRRGSEVQVVIRGDGGEAERLREEAERRRLGNLHFRPLVPPERLGASLAEGDIHLVPQDGKAADYAVPSKVYGIMAAGRPFVATAQPGSHLWGLRDRTGAFRCVPPGDAEALADAVLALAADVRQRTALGARGRAFVVAHHEKARVLGAFATVLRRQVAPPGAELHA